MKSTKANPRFFRLIAHCIWMAMWGFSPALLPAQDNADSLWSVWNDAARPDTSRLKSMKTIIWEGYLYSQPDSAFELAQLQYDLARSTDDRKWMAEALNAQGVSFKVRGDFEEALKHFRQALDLRREVGDQKAIAASMNNIGVVHDIQGEFSTAQDWYRQSLEVSKQIGDKEEIANTLSNLGASAMDQGDNATAVANFEESLLIWEEMQDRGGIAQSSLNIGYIYYKQGDYSNAIDWLMKSYAIFEELGKKANSAYVMALTGEIYHRQDDLEQAQLNFEASLKLGQEIGAKGTVSNALRSLGNIARDRGNYPKALDLYDQSYAIRKEMNDKGGMAAALNGIASTYRDRGEYDAAIAKFGEALALRREMGARDGVAATLNGMAATYLLKGECSKAIGLGEEALQLAQEIGNTGQIASASKNLYECYKKLGRTSQALEMHEMYISMNDSIKSEESQRQVLRQEYQYAYEKKGLADSLEFAKKEAIKDLQIQKNEVAIANQQIALFSATGGLLLIIALAFAIYRGKRRSDELLLNILPAETAKELKAKGSADARRIPEVTVLFTDFKGFTAISQQLSPEALVADLNECFSRFDQIMDQHNVEKIKTIGDAYMAAGGLPTPNATHARDVVMAALDIRDFMAAFRKDREARGIPFFEVRIGVHTGPVVAGIVGVKKFQYDIWGDTVNTASRMESSGASGQVNISDGTYQKIKDQADLAFTARGKVLAKGKGELEMYFVDRG